MVIVTKFGGSSVKDGATLEHVINNIILQDKERRINVLSAPRGITDLLIDIGNSYYELKQCPEELVEKVKSRFEGIARYFNIESDFLTPLFDKLDDAILKDSPNINEYLDGIKPYGEIINSEIIAEILRKQGINSKVYRPEKIGMETDGNFSSAKLKEASYQKIAETLNPVLKESDEIIIVPGFYGVDERGNFTTFQRGGSDLTGAILANAVDAELYENWTDIDGIRRADPDIIKNPDSIKRMTYREAREYAYSGARVLHPDTLTPLMKKNIPLQVRNTFNLENDGTYIGATKEVNGHIVEGIVHKEGFTMLYIEKIGMNEEIGYLSRLTQIFAEHAVSIDQMTTSIDSVSIAVAANGNRGNISAVRDDVIRLGLVDNPNGINIGYDRTMVCVVGEGMRHTPGVLEKVSGALRSKGINIETVYQGPSERTIIFGLAQKDAVKAVQSIYALYFNKPTK